MSPLPPVPDKPVDLVGMLIYSPPAANLKIPINQKCLHMVGSAARIAAVLSSSQGFMCFHSFIQLTLTPYVRREHFPHKSGEWGNSGLYYQSDF